MKIRTRTRKTLQNRLDEGQTITNALNNNTKAQQQKKHRLRTRLKEIMSVSNNQKCYFMTFTIAPNYYGKETEFYVKAIKKALHDVSRQYIFNEDYGANNERLHFHAVLQTDTEIITEYIKGDNFWTESIYHYGLVHVALINLTDERSKPKIQEYILKTENHTVKNTTGRIYYSKRKKTT